MWMFNCRHVTELVSQLMDHKLPWWQRLGIRVHHGMCKYCRRVKDQFLLLRSASRFIPDTDYLSEGPALSAAAKNRIKQSMALK